MGVGWEKREGDGRGDGDGALINGRNCTSLTVSLFLAVLPRRGYFSPDGRIGGGDLVKIKEGGTK